MKPGVVTAAPPKQNRINVIASGAGVCGAGQKIPLWINVPPWNKMRNHPLAGIVPLVNRFDGWPCLRCSKAAWHMF
jgi:hypothetical protein